MKSIRSVLFLLVCSLSFIGCSNSKEQVPYEEMNFEELFNYFLNTKNRLEEESLVKMLDDSLTKYPYRFFYPSERVDSIHKQITFEFKLVEEDYDIYADYKIKIRNLFLIHINRKNQIHAQKERINSCDSIIDNMILFIKNEENDECLPEKKIDVIELLDTVHISKAYFTLISQSQRDSLHQRSDWLAVKNAISSIRLAYKSVRDDAALSYWNRRYQELKFNPKKSITRLYPIHIWFYPNPTNLDWLALPKPPPPPPSVLSEEIIEIIEEAEEELNPE